MKKLLAIASALVTVAAFTACQDVEIQDGRIPADYQDSAQVLVGTYTGYLATSVSQVEKDKEQATLKVRIIDGRPVLTTSADFMGPGCGSSIGQLERVSVEGNGKLRQVIFSFNGGRCAAADHIVLNVFQRTDDGRVKVYAFVQQDIDYHNGDTQTSAPTETDRVGQFTAVQ